ncbi:MAG: hypothetical protein HY292_26565 [Planctomycetes bacterium]|nr:hypothetical protein [Planctomycetota bacterium]
MRWLLVSVVGLLASETSPGQSGRLSWPRSLQAGVAAQGSASPIRLANLGMAANRVTAAGDLLIASVSESRQGRDLDGDGDATDAIVEVLDVPTGAMTNLGSGSFSCSNGRYVVFVRSETDRGEDLNGDGDTNDNVIHVYDAETGDVTNLGYAVGQTFFFDSSEGGVFDGDLIPFTVSESAQGGVDLNGDSDLVDGVVHVYDPSTGTTTNVGLALRDARLWVGGHMVVFLAWEADNAHRDLDGNGDIDGSVVVAYDAQTRSTRVLGSGNPMNFGRNVLAYTVSESGHPVQDLNGDGDTNDDVVFAFDAVSGTITNLGLAAQVACVGENLVFIPVAESAQGQTDLDGDGNTNGNVLFVYDVRDGSMSNLHLQNDPGDGVWIDGDRGAFRVPERGVDLDGDGDGDDHVAFLYDGSSKVTMNLGWAVARLPRVSGNLVVLPVSEFEQGQQDENGDGDATDVVAQVFDISMVLTTNLGLAMRPQAAPFEVEVGDELVYFPVPENSQGHLDLNGDGDATDLFVEHVYDARSGTTTNLGVNEFPQPSRVGRNFVAFLVSEADRGVDLNGDGDGSDRVAHIALRGGALPCAFGNVNAGSGPVTPVLRVNGTPGIVSVPAGTPFDLSLSAPQEGPPMPRYVLWVWPGRPSSSVDLIVGAHRLGCTLAPTPLRPSEMPQPIFCLRSSDVSGSVCGAARELRSPPRAPWSLVRTSGLPHGTFTLQGVIADRGASSSTGYSVTNAVTLSVR